MPARNLGRATAAFALSLPTGIYGLEFVPRDDVTIWIALFGLAVIGIFALYLSSEKVKELNRKYQKILESHKGIEKRLEKAMDYVQKRLELSAREAVRHREAFETTPVVALTDTFIREEFDRFRKEETLLLDTAQTIKDFLQIKRGDVAIKRERFRLPNTLKEIFGRLHGELAEKHDELIVRLEQGLVEELEGDSQRLEQILTTLLREVIHLTREKQILVSATAEDGDKGLLLSVEVPHLHLNPDELAWANTPLSINDTSMNDQELQHFISRELIRLMGGRLTVISENRSGSSWQVHLPFPVYATFTGEKTPCPHRIIILAGNFHSMKATEALLCPSCPEVSCRGHLMGRRDDTLPDFKTADILVVDQEILTDNTIETIREVVQEHPLTVVVLQDSYEREAHQPLPPEVTDTILKPLMPTHLQTVLESHTPSETGQPAFEPPAEVSNLPEILTEEPEVTKEDLKKYHDLHVLIAEDNQLNQKILQGILNGSGMKVFLAGNGEEAIRLVEEHPEIDILFMDVNMPVMDGYEATRILRQSHSPQSLPIIAIENIGFESTDKRDVGFNAILQKPFKIGQFYRAFALYGTQEKASANFVEHTLEKYEPNSDVLDISVGIAHFITAVIYRETLKDVVEDLDTHREILRRLTEEKAHHQIMGYIGMLTPLAESIGAREIHQHLRSIEAAMAQDAQASLSEWMRTYEEAMERLNREVERYYQTTSLSFLG